MSGEIDAYSIEKRYIGKNGGIVHSEIYVKCVRRADGTPEYFFGLLHDIGERNRAEEEKARLHEQLLQARKLEAVGQLAGGVAHDFNNLLQIITGYTEFAREDLPQGHAAHEALGKVSGAAAKAAALVDQLLAFSRRQVLSPEPLNLNALVGGVTELLGRIIGEHIALRFKPAPRLWNTECDAAMIEQVVMNLCMNSRDAIGGKGAIELETRNAELDNAFCAANPWARPGRYVQLSVKDNGCGMDPATLEHLFEPFFTTQDKSKGCGLGLAMAYGIVRQHHGLLHADSEPGVGSCFDLYLPACAAGESASEQEGGGTILLAEDDDGVRMLTTRLLRNAGYFVLEARNGAEAVSVYRDYEGAVDLLLFDVVMPEMGGREAFDTIHALTPGVPVLYCSGYSENAVHADFVLPKGSRFVQKPYKPLELLEQVRSAIVASK